MSDNKTTSSPVTIGQILSHFLDTTDPGHTADTALRSWVQVLACLPDDADDSPLSLVDVRIISELLCGVGRMAQRPNTKAQQFAAD